MATESEKTLDAGIGQTGPLRQLMAQNDIVFALGLALVLATLLVPLPTFLLDLLLSVSIGVSLATLIVVLSAQESTEFSAFPSLLLFMTLFRLALNVASTRLILLKGQAGQIIYTFGNMVTGGGAEQTKLIIGLVVFLILVIIQFVVITKGAERISEVAARFHLDAMPGKQMAIDADLNAGLIGEQDARARREKIVHESEFYGAMDGSSKFIRGDAIAGLIIAAVNLVGGFAVGLSRGMTISQSMSTYSILAIGDGLVSQIPAIILATSAGFLISKSSSHRNISHDLLRQFSARSRPLGIVAFLLAAMVMVPSFPKIPFIVLALGAGLVARALRRQEIARESKPAAAPAAQPEEAPLDELLSIDRVCVQVGTRLIPLVDPRRKDSLSGRIAPLRRKFAQQFGLVLPLVRLRDNVALEPTQYEIRLHDHVVGSGRLEPEKLLAMDGGQVEQPIAGAEAREPVFNLPALWIRQDQKEQAELAGYTVVDPETVLLTHLSETLRRHAYELLSRDDVQKLTDRLGELQPALVKGVVGESLPMGTLHRVLQNLLREGIPIRDMAQIIEAVGDQVTRTKDPALLTEHARKALARTITEQYRDDDGGVHAIVLDPSLEYELRGALTGGGDGEALNLTPARALEFSRQAAEAWKSAMEQGRSKVALLCDQRLRPHLGALLARSVPQLPLVAYNELQVGTPIRQLASISPAQAELAGANMK